MGVHVATIRMRFRQIAELGRTHPEAVHAQEDDVRHIVLRAIADGQCDDPVADIARAALESADDPRWCA